MNVNQNIRWGIMGTGAVARAFARGLGHAPGAVLAAVGSRYAEIADRFARTFGALRSHGSYESLAADPEVDVIYVATPAYRHRDDCLLCLNAGKPVLCEKPFAMNASEASQIVQTAAERKLFCMEAMWMRFIPLVRRARQLVRDGAIGEVRSITADFALPAAAPPAGIPLTLDRGAMLDRGVYCLSLASFLLGEPERVASSATTTADGVDVHSSYLLTFRGGATALLFASRQTQGSNSAVIMGSKATLTLHEPFYRPHRLTMTMNRAPEPVGGAIEPPSGGLKNRLKESRLVQKIYRKLQPMLRRPAMDILEPVEGNGYNYEACEVMECLRAGKTASEIMPPEETVRIMELMDRIRGQWNAGGVDRIRL